MLKALLLIALTACAPSADSAALHADPASSSAKKCRVQWTKVTTSPATVTVAPGESVHLTATITTNCGTAVSLATLMRPQ